MLAKEQNNPLVESHQGTFLSSDSFFKGSIHFKDHLRIDGQFEGEIHSKVTLHIGKTDILKAKIKVGMMVAEGKIQGNIQAEGKVELRSTAQLFGNLKANKLMIAEGVAFVGHCEVNPQKEKIETFS